MACVPTIWKGYADTSIGQVHYRACGERTTIQQAQPLILLHQWPSSSAMWAEVLPRFAAKGYLVIAPDLPGFGESFLPREPPPDLAFYSNAALAALDRLSEDLAHRTGVGFERVHIVGHHFGAGVGVQMAVDWADRVERLVLWGPPLLSAQMREEFLNEAPPDYEDDQGRLILDFWKRRPRWWSKPGERMPGRLRARHLAAMLQMGPQRSWSHAAIARCDMQSLLKRVNQPVLCLAGESEILLAETKLAVDLVQNGELEIMPRVGLDVADECPDEFVAIVIRFLSKKTEH